MRTPLLGITALSMIALFAGNANALAEGAVDVSDPFGYCIGVSYHDPWYSSCLGASEDCIGYSEDYGWYHHWCAGVGWHRGTVLA